MAELDDAARRIQAECLCTRARQVARTISKICDDALRPIGLQSSQLTLLVTVQRFGEGGAAITALARVMGTDRTTLSRNLGPLEKSGLLRVARSPADSRVRLVLLTRRGEEAILAGFPLWHEAHEELRFRLGVPRSERFATELDRVERALEARADPVSRRGARR